MARIAFWGDFRLCDPQLKSRMKETLEKLADQNDALEFITCMGQFEVQSPFTQCLIQSVQALKERRAHQKIKLIWATMDSVKGFPDEAKQFDEIIFPLPPSDKPFYRQQQSLDAWLHKEGAPNLVITYFYDFLSPTESKRNKRFKRGGAEVINLVDEEEYNAIYQRSQRLPPRYAKLFAEIKAGKSRKEIACGLEISRTRVAQMIRAGNILLHRQETGSTRGRQKKGRDRKK